MSIFKKKIPFSTAFFTKIDKIPYNIVERKVLFYQCYTIILQKRKLIKIV
jgi:hypothetical protein